MSIEDKLQSAIALIVSYNKEQSDESDHINVDDFQKKLRKIGGTTDELLGELKWEDLEKCGIPPLLARRIATIFRKPSEPSKHVSDKHASRMSVEELVASYNPEDATNSIGKRLNEIAKGKKFIVFSPNGTVDVKTSTMLLRELQKNYDERPSIDINNKPTRIYAIGESLGTFVDENPIYAGRPLRPDGTCDQLGRSWEGVGHAVRQIIYLATHKTGESSVSFENAHNLLDMALEADAEKRLRTRFKKASLLLDELVEAGDAPKLKVKLGESKSSSKKNNPFYANVTY